MDKCLLCENQKLKKSQLCRKCKALVARARVKLKAIVYKGGECSFCHIKGHPAIYEFHHIEPNKKDFQIGSNNYSWKKVKKELDKCILLCSNCHQKEHANRYNTKITKYIIDNPIIEADSLYVDWLDEEQKKEYQSILKTKLSEKDQKSKECLYCRKSFTNVKKSKFCSKECFHKATRKIERPSKKELEQKIQTMSWCAIGREYGVSDNAVRKWAKSYSLLY